MNIVIKYKQITHKIKQKFTQALQKKLYFNIVDRLIVDHWYKNKSGNIANHDNVKCSIRRFFFNIIPFAILIIPTLIYYLIIKSRHMLFLLQIGKYKTKTANKPIIIVGNIVAGGVGKTPLVKYLFDVGKMFGIQVGVALRGYTSCGTSLAHAKIVDKNDDPRIVGDEALIYANWNIPVAIGKKRIDAVNLLIDNIHHLDVVILDDGLQHYYINRNYEIIVQDASKKTGNDYLLPYGPLREPLSRLDTVECIVDNITANDASNAVDVADIVNVNDAGVDGGLDGITDNHSIMNINHKLASSLNILASSAILQSHDIAKKILFTAINNSVKIPNMWHKINRWNNKDISHKKKQNQQNTINCNQQLKIKQKYYLKQIISYANGSMLDIDSHILSYKSMSNLMLGNQAINNQASNILAISAIGNNERFFKFLMANHIYVKEHIKYPDHYNFELNDVKHIVGLYLDKKYDVIITTQKDYVKLKPIILFHQNDLPIDIINHIYVVEVDVLLSY